MNITVHPTQPVEVRLAGRFDAHETDGFRQVADGIIGGDVSSFDVVLTDVAFIDSSALAELVRSMKRARERGGDVRLVGPSDPVMVILELTGLDRAFDIIDN